MASNGGGYTMKQQCSSCDKLCDITLTQCPNCKAFKIKGEKILLQRFIYWLHLPDDITFRNLLLKQHNLELVN